MKKRDYRRKDAIFVYGTLNYSLASNLEYG